MRWVIYGSKKYDSRENDARSHKVHERRFLPFRVQKLWKSMTIIVKIEVVSIQQQAVKLFFLKENLYDVIRQGQLSSSSSITCKQPKCTMPTVNGILAAASSCEQNFRSSFEKPSKASIKRRCRISEICWSIITIIWASLFNSAQ